MSMKIEGGKVVIQGPVTAQELAFRVRRFMSFFGIESQPRIQIKGRWDRSGILNPPNVPQVDVLELPEPCPVVHVGRLYITIETSALTGDKETIIPERGTDVVVELYLPQ